MPPTTKNYLLRVIPTNWNSGRCSDIPSCIYSDILSGILSSIFSDILSGILSCTLSDIYSDILSGIYSFSVFLCHYLHSIWHWHSFWHLFWHSIWHLFRHSFWLAFYLESILAFYLAFFQAFILAFYLASILTFYLAIYLAFFLAFYQTYILTTCLAILSGILSGILSAKADEDKKEKEEKGNELRLCWLKFLGESVSGDDLGPLVFWEAPIVEDLPLRKDGWKITWITAAGDLASPTSLYTNTWLSFPRSPVQHFSPTWTKIHWSKCLASNAP